MNMSPYKMEPVDSLDLVYYTIAKVLTIATILIFSVLVLIGNIMRNTDIKACDIVELIPVSDENSRVVQYVGPYGGRVSGAMECSHSYTWAEGERIYGFNMYATCNGDNPLPDAIVIRRDEDTENYWYLSEDNQGISPYITILPLTKSGKVDTSVVFK